VNTASYRGLSWMHGNSSIHTVTGKQGLNCPLPLLECKVPLNRLAAGQVLHILATDPMASLDFQAFCARTGWTI